MSLRLPPLASFCDAHLSLLRGAVLTHAVGQPMVLIEADTGGEWKVRADAHKHPSPVAVIDVSGWWQKQVSGGDDSHLDKQVDTFK